MMNLMTTITFAIAPLTLLFSFIYFISACILVLMIMMLSVSKIWKYRRALYFENCLDVQVAAKCSAKKSTATVKI